MILRPGIVLILSAVLLLCGCGPAERDVDREKLEAMVGGELKETVAISGSVTINGEPAAGVNIYAYTAANRRQPAAQTRTNTDGTYCWTTYTLCDGLPVDEYQLAFTFIPNEGKGRKEGVDMLKGKYRDPSKSGFTLTVQRGTPQTDVKYELNMN